LKDILDLTVKNDGISNLARVVMFSINHSFWFEDLLAKSSVLTYSPQPQDVAIVDSYDLKATDHGSSNFIAGDCLHISNLHHMMAKKR
jgi:hypothetical protein